MISVVVIVAVIAIRVVRVATILLALAAAFVQFRCVFRQFEDMGLARAWCQSATNASCKGRFLSIQRADVRTHVLVLGKRSIELFNAVLVTMDSLRDFLVILDKTRNVIHERTCTLGPLSIQSQSRELGLN